MKAARVNKLMELLSVALVSLSKDFSSDHRVSRVYLTVDQAVADRALMLAMSKQIEKSFLIEEYPGFFVAGVDYNTTTYIISGTHERWINFFTINT